MSGKRDDDWELARLRRVETRLEAMLPLFQEARDALSAIKKRTAVLRGIRLDLADRMDDVGIAERWLKHHPWEADAATGGD